MTKLHPHSGEPRAEPNGALFETDYTKIPSAHHRPRQVLCALGLLAALGLAFLLDEDAAKIFALSPDNAWYSVAAFLSKAGQGWVIASAGAILSLLFLIARRLRPSRSVLLVALTGLLTGAMATVLRSLIGRTRPGSKEVQGFYGIWHHGHWIFGRAEFGSFPSGHAATVMGLAMAAWLVDRRFGMVATVYALLVMWSRIALGCHHFSDVVAAAILGIYSAPVVLRIVNKWVTRTRLKLDIAAGKKDENV